MRARYYDPAIRRFISEDPTGFGGGDVNLYAYVGGNPINGVDPSGLFGVFGRLSGRVTVPAASFDAQLGLIVGSEGNGVRATLTGSTGYTALAGGAAVGRGYEFGFFLNDVSDFSNSSATNFDTPLGGFTIYTDQSGGFQGFGVAGPSLGLAVTYNGIGGIGVTKGFNFDLYNSSNQSLSVGGGGLCTRKCF